MSLCYLMQLTGMNALFGLQVHITVGERMIVAVAVSHNEHNNNNIIIIKLN